MSNPRNVYREIIIWGGAGAVLGVLTILWAAFAVPSL